MAISALEKIWKILAIGSSEKMNKINKQNNKWQTKNIIRLTKYTETHLVVFAHSLL